MKYRNIKTGQVIDVSCECKGENWERLDAAPEKPAGRKTKTEPDIIEPEATEPESETVHEDEAEIEAEPEIKITPKKGKKNGK